MKLISMNRIRYIEQKKRVDRLRTKTGFSYIQHVREMKQKTLTLIGSNLNNIKTKRASATARQNQ